MNFFSNYFLILSLKINSALFNSSSCQLALLLRLFLIISEVNLPSFDDDLYISHLYLILFLKFSNSLFSFTGIPECFYLYDF